MKDYEKKDVLSGKLRIIKKYWCFACIGILILTIVLGVFIIRNVIQNSSEKENDKEQMEVETTTETEENISNFPHIAGYVKNGEDLLINEDIVYDIVYSSEIDINTADKLREKNENTIILFQSPLNYMFDSAVPVIEAITESKISDDFWLSDNNGNRCGYGMSPEMYAIDIGNDSNIELISLFFSSILDMQSHYDGLFFDVVEEKSRCDSMTDDQWVEQTTNLLESIRDKIDDKIILVNSGYGYSLETPYLSFINGYSLESFLSGAAGFDEGMQAAEIVMENVYEPKFLIYTVYSENTITGEQIGSESMRLALSLSLLYDFTYLHYDSSLAEVGSLLWESQFSAELGNPIDDYYKKDGAYWREYENGIVVCSPDVDTDISLEEEMLDITDNTKSKSFTLRYGDGRIFINL